ncbi:sensor of ECF-type sigma factor [uncultured Aquimarina sp.]|uniref:sensor of ECF-type sigma factor n=1 Tax=uncultured Aquimarina sp. TaxID=575652 RepID=UPI002614F85D|nr:sensor of ECF-type sigma factor [uncultured Aquimarina sp.]
MKKILLLFIIVFTINVSYSQRGSRERVKTLKIAYITEQLNLSSKEAQQFWPIYNEHDETMDSLKKEERRSIKLIKDADGSEGISEKEAEEFLRNHLKGEEQKLNVHKKLIKDLRQVISHKKILKLVKAEREFNKRLLKQLRNRRQRQ